MASQLDATKREQFESIARFPTLKKLLDLSPLKKGRLFSTR